MHTSRIFWVDIFLARRYASNSIGANRPPMLPTTQQKQKEPLEDRVIRAAEAALADHQYVSLIDVLTGMRLLHPSHVEAWRKGRLDSLEEMIQGSPDKTSRSIGTFLKWASEKGLQPSEARYVRATRSGTVDLRFTMCGDTATERNWRIHYVSPALTGLKRQAVEEGLQKAPEPVVFLIVRDSQCTECGIELPQDSFLFMDASQALCLACAGLAELEYLPA